VPRLKKILDYMYYTTITLQPQQIFIGLIHLILIADYYPLTDHAFALLFSKFYESMHQIQVHEIPDFFQAAILLCNTLPD